MKARYFLFTLSFIVLGTAKAEIIPKDKLEDYKNAVVLGTNDSIECNFKEYWGYSSHLKDIIPYAITGYTNDDQTQPVVTLTVIGQYAERSEFDFNITTDVSFKEVIKVDIFRRDLISEYTNLGTIAKPKMIKSKSWKTTYIGSCK
ncbi:MAG: hypothetical protein ACXVCY_08675 [Pseudobdellovibrionaceae bacterium]